MGVDSNPRWDGTTFTFNYCWYRPLHLPASQIIKRQSHHRKARQDVFKTLVTLFNPLIDAIKVDVAAQTRDEIVFVFQFYDPFCH